MKIVNLTSGTINPITNQKNYYPIAISNFENGISVNLSGAFVWSDVPDASKIVYIYMVKTLVHSYNTGYDVTSLRNVDPDFDTIVSRVKTITGIQNQEWELENVLVPYGYTLFLTGEKTTPYRAVGITQ